MDNKNQEKIKGAVSPEVKGEKHERPNALKELKERASKVVGTVESGDATSFEDSESGSERPSEFASESTSEDASGGGAGSAAKTQNDETIDEIRAKLLKALPPQREMVRQIKRTLLRQEKDLTKRMNSLQRRSHTTAFELTNVVAKLRQVQDFLSILAHATYEVIKNLWLKIVHGL